MKVSNVLTAWVRVMGLVVLGGWLAGCASGRSEFSELPAGGSALTAGETPAAPGSEPAPATSPGTEVQAATAAGQPQPSLGANEIFQVGDPLTVIFSDTPIPTTPILERVKDDGTITLSFNKVFVALNKSRGDLEKEIRAAYVPKIYQNLTVTIQIPERFYFVGGEVRVPSKQPYSPKLTVLKVIQTSGGFTDFANRKKVLVTRASGEKITVNCIKALKDPRLDVEVLPGDSINVPRTIW
jgi:polysaccharide export outer membrane protein